MTNLKMVFSDDTLWGSRGYSLLVNEKWNLLMSF
jgi:hypothetical protein